MNHAIFEPSDSSSWTSGDEELELLCQKRRWERRATASDTEKSDYSRWWKGNGGCFFYFGVGPTLQRWLEPPDEATGFGSFFLARIRGLKDNTGWSDLISFLAWFSIFFCFEFCRLFYFGFVAGCLLRWVFDLSFFHLLLLTLLGFLFIYTWRTNNRYNIMGL
jgi:hypothetical protein